MAAESATFLAHTRAGQRIVCLGDVYGGTFELLGVNLPQVGITALAVWLARADHPQAGLVRLAGRVIQRAGRSG
jgi:O-acetylhomoserine/O-acetylserine sulfhydrylase-like pyridoxal-dependent enzyme